MQRFWKYTFLPRLCIIEQTTENITSSLTSSSVDLTGNAHSVASRLVRCVNTTAILHQGKPCLLTALVNGGRGLSTIKIIRTLRHFQPIFKLFGLLQHVFISQITWLI